MTFFFSALTGAGASFFGASVFAGGALAAGAAFLAGAAFALGAGVALAGALVVATLAACAKSDRWGASTPRARRRRAPVALTPRRRRQTYAG